MPNGDEQSAWEYPISANLENDGDCPSEVRWRPWPCAACREHTTALDFLRGRNASSGRLPKGIWNRIVGLLQKREARWLVDWVEGCSHTPEETITLRKLAQGSEHVVYFDEGSSHVFDGPRRRFRECWSLPCLWLRLWLYWLRGCGYTFRCRRCRRQFWLRLLCGDGSCRK